MNPSLPRPLASARRWTSVIAAGLLALASGVLAASPGPAPAAGEPRWYKGNLHTHSLWSDGDDYPEMIADWYKQQGYHFLAISDHNVMAEGQRWLELKAPVAFAGGLASRGGGDVLVRYRARFGEHWVEQRVNEGRREVRLKPLAEYRTLFEEPARFLLIPSSEITSSWKRPATATNPEQGGPVHMNATNLRDLIAPVPGDNALDIMQRTTDAVMAQRERTGQPMFIHLNHPNFVWGVTAEDLMQVRHEKFFEVYNGHPAVNNDGDATRLSTDQMWDAILAHRLGHLGLGVMYGIGTDDSNHYHTLGIGQSNVGRGWVMVRARWLTPESIVHAMEAGDFYASSGVVLSEVIRGERELAVEIAAEPGVTYVTQFIGTRRGFDPASELLAPQADEAKRKTLPHRRYGPEVGAVLAEVTGPRAAYTLQGDELYVRAKIVSSKVKENGSVAGEVETAWTQPLVNPANR